MKKDSILIVCIIALLVLNLGTLGFLFSERNGHKPPPRPMHHEMRRPADVIIEKLNFDIAQKEAFQELIKDHKNGINELEEKRRFLKEELFSTLANESNSSDSILQQLGQVQIKIEQHHYKHFEEIKALCNEAQLANFKSLAVDLANIFKPQHPPKRQ